MMHDLDRFHLVADMIDRVPALGLRAAYVKQAIRDQLIEHRQYIEEFGEDLPEIRNWQWGATAPGRQPARLNQNTQATHRKTRSEPP